MYSTNNSNKPVITVFLLCVYASTFSCVLTGVCGKLIEKHKSYVLWLILINVLSDLCSVRQTECRLCVQQYMKRRVCMQYYY